MYISKMAQFFSLISCQIQHVFSFPNLIEINLCLFPKWLKNFFLYFSCQIQHVTIVQSTLSWVFFKKIKFQNVLFFSFSENQIFRFPFLISSFNECNSLSYFSFQCLFQMPNDFCERICYSNVTFLFQCEIIRIP